MDKGDGGSFCGSEVPALAKKIDLAVGVDAAFEVEGQMEVQQGSRRTGSCGGAFFLQGIFPGCIGAEPCGAAAGGVLALQLPVEHALGGGIAADFFIGEDCDQTFLQGAKAALNLALGLGAGRDQMGDAQSREGALELRAGITVIGHGIMAEEAEAIGVHDHGQIMPEKEAAEMLEVIPSGVGGDKDRAQEFARMIIDGQEQGLLFIGGPPLVDGGIMLPEFIDASAFPTPAGLGAGFRLADEVGQVCPGKGGHRLPVALEAEAGFQFVGDELEVGRFLQGQELLEKGDGLGRPVRPMIATRELGGEPRAFLEEAGAEPVKMRAADLEMVGGIRSVNHTLVELPEDLLEKQIGEAFADLLF